MHNGHREMNKGIQPKIIRVLSELQFRYLLVMLGIATIIILLLLNRTFDIRNYDPVWSNIIAGLITGIISFICIYFLFTLPGIKLPGMVSSLETGIVKGFFATHEDVDWDSLISQARSIDIVVHYYNRWAREREMALGKFFGQGGRLRVIMADPAIPGTLAAVHTHFFPNLSETQLADRIRETETVFREIHREKASPQGSLEIRYFPRALHYSLVLFDSRDLYLSVYEQFRGRIIRSSVFNLDLRRDSGMEDYWLQTLQAFVDQSRLA